MVKTIFKAKKRNNKTPIEIHLEIAEAFTVENTDCSMTKARAIKIMEVIDKNLVARLGKEYKKVLYNSLTEARILPLNPKTGNHYSVRECSNLDADTSEQDKVLLKAVHKFYTHVMDITGETVAKKMSVSDYLQAAKTKSMDDPILSKMIADVQSYYNQRVKTTEEGASDSASAKTQATALARQI